MIPIGAQTVKQYRLDWMSRRIPLDSPSQKDSRPKYRFNSIFPKCRKVFPFPAWKKTRQGRFLS